MSNTEYSNVSGLTGCWWKYPLAKQKEQRKKCEDETLNLKSRKADEDAKYAEAVLIKAKQVDQNAWSPLAITGVIVGSLFAITLMIVVIKRSQKTK
jgi:cobalamin biosynthesis Mg chelatase CobN